MARKATDDEERALTDERVVSESMTNISLPLIELKVVYLGANTKKTVRLHGQVIFDPDDPTEGVKKQVSGGVTAYDFASEDSRGRRLKKDSGRFTEDNKPFQKVMHLKHLMSFNDLRGADKEKVFELRGSKADVAAFIKYRDIVRAQRPDPDRGSAVLKDMADQFDK